MSHSLYLSRRRLLGSAAASLALSSLPPALGQTAAVSVYKDPACGCCGGWVSHLRAAGYPVSVEELADVEPIKRRLGVPAELWSCHTATINGYAVEGHVPAHAVARLLKERPSIAGLAVPGMPLGSPGMEGGAWDVYEVIGFEGPRRIGYGRYRGAKPA